jgi:hypothetical protein
MAQGCKDGASHTTASAINLPAARSVKGERLRESSECQGESDRPVDVCHPFVGQPARWTGMAAAGTQKPYGVRIQLDFPSH